LGNSGIGKTVSLNYILIRALEKGIRVLYETRLTRYYFDGDHVQSESLTDTKLERMRTDRSVLLLHDHQPRKEPLTDNGAFTVAPVSSNPINYKEFRKHDVMRLYMLLPTKPELLAMNSIEPNLTPTELIRRISLYGPIPHSIFRRDQEDTEKELATKINQFNLGPNLLSLLNAAELPEGQSGLSWWVVHVNGNKNLRGVKSVSWATDEIRSRVLSRIAKQSLTELEIFLVRSLHNPPLYATEPTKEYEQWATLTISGGMTLNVFYIDPINIKTRKRKGQCTLKNAASPKPSWEQEKHPALLIYHPERLFVFLP
jgi:hypothetical protein